MTLSPVDQYDRYTHADGPGYDVGFECGNPCCNRPARENHHVWRRRSHGKVGGSDWILDTETGDVLPNRCGLCSPCHRQLTGGIGGHQARILYNADDRVLHWLVRSEMNDEPGWESVGEVRWPVPPRFEAAAAMSGYDDRPTHQPHAWEAPIPGVHHYSACSDDQPKVNSDGVCEGCGGKACAGCGKELCKGCEG